MDEISERFRRVTQGFTDRVRGVAPDAWEDPSPCEGWTARDVVGHLTTWIPEFFGSQGIEFPEMPAVDDDPLGAWEAVRATIAGALADPATASQDVSTPFGTQSLAETVDMIVTGDVFIHTWDLARATGQDDTLDPVQLSREVRSIGATPEEAMRSGGMFGPWLDVPDDADDQTKYLAYVGRRA